MASLIRYLNAAAGLLVKSTWLSDIKSGIYASLPGLTYTHATKYCPDKDKTLKGHILQTWQGVRSTKPWTTPEEYSATSSPTTLYPLLLTKELKIWEELISKIYTDYMGRFPIRSCIGNLYLILSYQCDCNIILVEPFLPKQDRHRLATYKKSSGKSNNVATKWN